MKNLSKEKIELKVTESGQKYKSLDAIDYETDWDLSFFKGIETRAGANYYKLFIHNGQIIPVTKNVECNIRKVEKGFVKDCFVLLIKERGQEDGVFLVGDRGVVRLPVDNASDLEKVDQCLSREVLEKMVAKQLNTFSIRKGKVQWYELMCERLPSRCWKDKKFVENVTKEFLKSDCVNIEDDVDLRFVDVAECKKQAGEFFSAFVKKQEKQDERIK